ncbi:MAG: NEW3 domain-containing protein [Dehalococcoidales bacterium]
MKIGRIICLLLVSLLAISPFGNVFAQEEEEPEYVLVLTPMGERYDTSAVAGKDKHLIVDVENLGTASIDNITFSSDQPEGWLIKFSPDKVALLGANDSETIDITITPPGITDPGDYMVTLRASGTQASAKEIDIRVNVTKPVKEEKIELLAIYPTVEAIAGEDFEFEVEYRYTGAGGVLGESRDFELKTTVPEGWEVYITPRYEKEKKISAISLKPGVAYGERTRVVVTPRPWPLPEPGEYQITFEAVSGELRDSIELKAIITAKYVLALAPATERYNTKAKAGRDNYFSAKVGNLGTAAIDNINFSSDKPQGWTIEFSPDKVDLLEAFDTQTIDVNIKPPPETIAGDYMVTLRASGTQASSEAVKIRITVETPTIWGWVGVGIIALVIAGLVFIFMRFSRR